MGRSDNNEHIYIVFSSTPYMMGRFVRLFVDGKYNHVSISVDEDLSEVYSFARFYRQAPFFGGFVKESAGRFHVGSKISDIIVCAVPVSAEKKADLTKRLHAMQKERDKYLYNLFSAVCVPIKKRIFVRDAYTCVEFAALVLRLIGFGIGERDFLSIDQLMDMLMQYKIYEGPFPEAPADDAPTSDADDFEHAVSYKLRYGSLIKQVNLLASRMMHT